MAIKTIQLSQLATELQKTLNDCADSGDTVVVELPDQRLVAIQSLDTLEEEGLVEELLESNSDFQAMVSKSKNSKRKVFALDQQ